MRWDECKCGCKVFTYGNVLVGRQSTILVNGIVLKRLKCGFVSRCQALRFRLLCEVFMVHNMIEVFHTKGLKDLHEKGFYFIISKTIV